MKKFYDRICAAEAFVAAVLLILMVVLILVEKKKTTDSCTLILNGISDDFSTYTKVVMVIQNHAMIAQIF